MEEIIRSIKAHLYEKNVSPLAGAFLLATIALNFEVAMILFADIPHSQKFAEIDAYFSLQLPNTPDWVNQLLGRVWWGVLWPLIVSVIYLIGYPYIAQPIYRLSLKFQRALREERQQSEEQKLLSVEESRALLVEVEKLKRANEDLTEDFRTTRNNLLEENERLQGELEAIQGAKPEENEEEEGKTYEDEQVEELLSSVDVKSEVTGPNLDELDGSPDDRAEVEEFMVKNDLKFAEKDLLSNQVIRAVGLADKMGPWISEGLDNVEIGKFRIEDLFPSAVYERLRDEDKRRLDELAISVASNPHHTGIFWNKDSSGVAQFERLDMNDKDVAERERSRREDLVTSSRAEVGPIQASGTAEVMPKINNVVWSSIDFKDEDSVRNHLIEVMKNLGSESFTIESSLRATGDPKLTKKQKNTLASVLKRMVREGLVKDIGIQTNDEGDETFVKTSDKEVIEKLNSEYWEKGEKE